MDFFATAAKGTEPFLRDELREIHIPHVRCDRGGVHFSGSWPDAWKVCLYSRIALRVFYPLASFSSTSRDDLYQGVFRQDWSPYLTPQHTLAVTAHCRDSGLTHTNFIAQIVKDAIVDQQRQRYGSRPNVDRNDPDLRIFTLLKKNQATVYLDLAGDSLHRRGYRQHVREAPLKETMAAAMLRFSGWDRESPLMDPMCGSGTILIEAALWSRGIAPGLQRQKFGFQRWPLFDDVQKRQWKDVRGQALSLAGKDNALIIGGDLDPAALDAARKNAQAAKVRIELSRKSALDQKPFESVGFVVSNPPYGKRLRTESQFYRDLGNNFRLFKKHTLCFLLGDPRLARCLNLRSERFQIVYNGDIECRIIRIRL